MKSFYLFWLKFRVKKIIFRIPGTQRKFLLLFFSLLFFGGTAEIISRVKYKPEQIKYTGIFEYDRDKIYRLKSSFSGKYVGKPVFTNSYGYRDVDIPVSKPGKTIRILVVGDSISFGHGVYAEETYPEILEGLLEKRFPAFQFNVINTAVPGNSTFQEYYDLKRGLAFQPDIAILQFTLNDVVEPYWVFRRFGGAGKDYHKVEDIPYYHYFLSQRSAFYLFMCDLCSRMKFRNLSGNNIRAAAIDREIYSSKNLVYHPERGEIKSAWKECLTWMRRMVDLSKKKNVELVLFFTPFEFQFDLDPRMAIPQKELRTFARQNNIRYVDLLEILQEDYERGAAMSLLPANSHSKERHVFWRKYFLDHDHYNAAGHNYVANKLLPIIGSKIDKLDGTKSN